MRVLLVCNSILGDGETSGSSIRAKKFEEVYDVERIGKHNLCFRQPFFYFIFVLCRSLPALRKKYDVVYSISDLLPDGVFSIVYKLTHRETKFICGVHSLVQRHIKGRTWFHSFYSYWSQQIILWLLKHTADRVLVSNDYDKEILKSKGFRNVVTVYGAPNF